MRRDVFQAIADPTRREILTRIAKGPMNLNTVAEAFTVSRPAVSKHVKILAECGLVEVKQEGRERYCEAKLDKLREVNEWLRSFERFWNKKLDALGDFLVEKQHRKQQTQNRKS